LTKSLIKEKLFLALTVSRRKTEFSSPVESALFFPLMISRRRIPKLKTSTLTVMALRVAYSGAMYELKLQRNDRLNREPNFFL